MDRRILVVVFALALGGCSRWLDTKDLDPLDSVEPFCETLFDEYLATARDCSGWTQQLVDYEYGRALGVCAAFGWSESKGRVGYDRAAAEACLSAVRHAPCTVDLERAMDGCKSAIPGTRPNGGDCNDEVECADPEASCRHVQPTCPGTCLAPGRLDEPCGSGYPPCATGFYCDSTSWRCGAAAPENTTCSPVALTNCGENARCSNATSTCVRDALEGQPCSTERPCVSTGRANLFCDDHNANPPVCRPYGTVPLGGKCDSSEQCDLAGRCDLSAGQPGSCVERLGSGSPCSGDSECARPLVCVGDTVGAAGPNGRCGLRLSEGAICEPTSADCQIGSACMPSQSGSTTCQPWPSQIGGACGVHPAEKLCYVGQCVGTSSPACQEWLQPQAACTSDQECGFGGFDAARCEMTANGADQRFCVPSCLAR